MYKPFAFLLVLATAVPLRAAAADAAGPAGVRVSVGDVTDTRTTGQFFGGLEVELVAVGDAVYDVESFRAVVDSATDDTGRNLVKEDEDDPDFSSFGLSNNPNQVKADVKLKNPARRASAIKQLAGRLDIFVPSRDPQATVQVPRLLEHTGKPLPAPALAAAGVQVTPLTKDEYEAIKEQQKKEAEAKAKEQMGDDFGGAMAQAFMGMFGGLMNVGPNGIILQIEDPDQRIIAVDFVDGAGEEVRPQSWSKMQDGSVRTYSFGSAPQPDWGVKLYLATDKAMLRVPFAMTDIPLP